MYVMTISCAFCDGKKLEKYDHQVLNDINNQQIMESS